MSRNYASNTPLVTRAVNNWMASVTVHVDAGETAGNIIVSVTATVDPESWSTAVRKRVAAACKEYGVKMVWDCGLTAYREVE